MDLTSQLQVIPRRIEGLPQHPGTEAPKRYLTERGYARHTLAGYLGDAAHFLRWMQQGGIDVCRADELLVAPFRDEHFPHSITAVQDQAKARAA